MMGWEGGGRAESGPREGRVEEGISKIPGQKKADEDLTDAEDKYAKISGLAPSFTGSWSLMTGEG